MEVCDKVHGRKLVEVFVVGELINAERLWTRSYFKFHTTYNSLLYAEPLVKKDKKEL